MSNATSTNPFEFVNKLRYWEDVKFVIFYANTFTGETIAPYILDDVVFPIMKELFGMQMEDVESFPAFVRVVRHEAFREIHLRRYFNNLLLYRDTTEEKSHQHNP